MQQAMKDQRQEADVLTDAVEGVLRRFIRFLIGRMSLARLNEMVRQIFVEEAEARLRSDNPLKNVTMSKLALLTGLDTRTLAKIRSSGGDRRAAGQTPRPTKFLNAESAVVEAWITLARFQEDEGAPRELEIDDEHLGFAALVKEAVNARGVTIQSVLQSLEATETVSVDREAKTVRLLVDRYSPFYSDDQLSRTRAGMEAVTHVLDTVGHNIESEVSGRFLQRELWTYRLHPDNHSQFRSAMRKLLEDMEADCEAKMVPWEEDDFRDEYVAAGVGLYYFEM